jgi:hypothetical protein
MLMYPAYVANLTYYVPFGGTGVLSRSSGHADFECRAATRLPFFPFVPPTFCIQHFMLQQSAIMYFPMRHHRLMVGYLSRVLSLSGGQVSNSLSLRTTAKLWVEGHQNGINCPCLISTLNCLTPAKTTNLRQVRIAQTLGTLLDRFEISNLDQVSYYKTW